MKRALWHKHHAVRTGDQLTAGERAADHLKAAFGSWTFLIILNVFIIGWIVFNVALPRSSRWDIYPFILLNLGLSWLAAQQGGALQIASNRGDRIASEVALHTEDNTNQLISLSKRQMEILERQDKLTEEVHALARAIRDTQAKGRRS